MLAQIDLFEIFLYLEGANLHRRKYSSRVYGDLLFHFKFKLILAIIIA
jgi:hypothetical protein